MSVSFDINATIVVRKQHSYTKPQWENRRKIITTLSQQVVGQKLVLRILNEEYKFYPTLGMLKKKLHEWGLDRKNKEADIVEAVRIILKRRREGKRTTLDIRGRIVDEHEVKRYLARKNIRDPQAWAASFPEVTPSEVKLCTPVASLKPDDEVNQDDVEVISLSSDRCLPGLQRGAHAIEPEWPEPCETIRAFAETGHPFMPLVVSPAVNIAGLSNLSAVETLLTLNEEHHAFMSHLAQFSFNNVNNSRGPSVPTWQLEQDGQVLLNTFSNGMWRGRDLLLDDRKNDAIRCFYQAFDTVGTLLQPTSSGQFLRELYEMILNFQLNDTVDIIPHLLSHIGMVFAATSDHEARSMNWRLRQIMSTLKKMTLSERVETVDRLMRRMRDTYLLADQVADGCAISNITPSGASEAAQSIEKTLSRSVFRREPIENAIACLRRRLQDRTALAHMDCYEQGILHLELAQCHRYRKEFDQVEGCVRQAWHQAAGIVADPARQNDLKIRCTRTMALVEARRGNLQLASLHGWHAVHYADSFLGPQDSLTWLVKAELDDVTSKFEALGLEEPAPPAAFHDLF